MNDLTDEEKERLRVMLDTWEQVQTGIKVVSAVGSVVKWLSAIVVSVAAAWTVWYHKGTP